MPRETSSHTGKEKELTSGTAWQHSSPEDPARLEGDDTLHWGAGGNPCWPAVLQGTQVGTQDPRPGPHPASPRLTSLSSILKDSVAHLSWSGQAVRLAMLISQGQVKDKDSLLRKRRCETSILHGHGGAHLQPQLSGGGQPMPHSRTLFQKIYLMRS